MLPELIRIPLPHAFLLLQQKILLLLALLSEIAGSCFCLEFPGHLIGVI